MGPLSTALHIIKWIVGNGQSGDLIWLLVHGIAQAYISVTGVLCCPSVCTLLFAQQQNTVLHSITQVVCTVQECSIVHPSVLFVLLPVCECATRRNHTSVFPPFSHRRYPALVRSNWHLCRTIIESSLWWWAAKICEFRRNPTLFMDPLLPPKTFFSDKKNDRF